MPSLLLPVAGASRACRSTSRSTPGCSASASTPTGAAELAATIASHAPTLRLAGVFTHLAMADEPDDPFTAEQLARLDAVLDEVPSSPPGDGAGGTGLSCTPRTRQVRWHSPTHAGRSCAPASRSTGSRPATASTDLCDATAPGDVVDGAGRRTSNGSRRAAGSPTAGVTSFERDTTVATVPIGYADGVPRRLCRQSAARCWSGAAGARSSAWSRWTN